MNTTFQRVTLAAMVVLALASSVITASAHCDTMNGPVVAAARLALEKGDVTPVLKWVKPEAEPEIRAAFARTLKVRGAGPEARDLADLYFFETLVRVHRAGEGAPYTGLKPADTDVGPAVKSADQALESGSADAVVTLVTSDIAAGIHQRFTHAMEAKRHVDESVERGRAYVAAYVEYVHFVENIHLAAGSAHAQHAEAKATQLHAELRK
jgi:hypothetical protein